MNGTETILCSSGTTTIVASKVEEVVVIAEYDEKMQPTNQPKETKEDVDFVIVFTTTATKNKWFQHDLIGNVGLGGEKKKNNET
jgi:deoxycytidylate deaminase